jgi:SAM-dependent methyltransferase
MPDSPTTSYDSFPYGDRAHGRTHPDVLATVATLFGMAPAPPERCRVLELGCAGGANLIAMAEALPDSRFLGVDLSARQVASGRARVEAKGLANVEMREMSISDVREDFGRFDYIICHGVYSWVLSDVRDAILKVCAANLEPQGVAYVSYNCYPGWHDRAIVREMMAFHARGPDEPRERVRLAREFLAFAAAAVGDAGGVCGPMLRDESHLIAGLPDYYVYHEHLAEVNHPVHFHEFVAQAACHGLQYLWEAHVGELGTGLRPDVREAVRALSPDLVVQQQYLDFLLNNRFRCSLLCRDDVELDRTMPAERMTAFRVVGVAAPRSARPDVGSTSVEEFRTAEGIVMATNNPVFKAALACLAERAPEALSFDELCTATRSRLAGFAVGEPVPDKQLPWYVADLLRQGALSRLVELHVGRCDPTGSDDGRSCNPGDRLTVSVH